MFNRIKFDLPAGLVVFLVALPLCLGVSLASGAPLLSGVISGIIGGLVVGTLSQSHVSVSGPAAGLTAVVLVSIKDLGSFDLFLMALFIAGFLQVIAGAVKAGFVSNFIPTSVIKGLLSAIGIILILKQIPHAVGYDVDNEEDFSFFQKDGENTFSELLNVFDHFNYGALIIALVSLFILIFWDKTPLKKWTYLPVSLVVVVIGMGLNTFFYHYTPDLFLKSSHLVNLPQFTGFSDMITFADFSGISNYKVWGVAFTLAIIASIETLLNLQAVQNIDPYRRKASSNRELIAQGIGNSLSGLIGGIPLTSVIVRSSVNINAGNKTKMSAIYHGLFLLLSVVLLVPIMNLIPLSCLAAILLVTGYKLAKYKIFKEMFQKGWNQFLPFVITIIAIVFTDLLYGVIIGLGVSVFFILKNSFLNSFKVVTRKQAIGETLNLKLPQQVTFLNKDSIKEALWVLPENAKVIIDASQSNYIDDDIIELLKEFKETIAKEREIQLNMIGFNGDYDLEDKEEFTQVLDKETQEKLTPEEVLELLMKGNERFMRGEWTEKYFRNQVSATSTTQNPMAVVLSCVDSRSTPEFIFDIGLGDLISIRIAGNVITNEVLESIEFSCKKLGTKLVIILGHSNCGAVGHSIEAYPNTIIKEISERIERSVALSPKDRKFILADKDAYEDVIIKNIHFSKDDLFAASPYLKKRVEEKSLMVVTAYYDTSIGEVKLL